MAHAVLAEIAQRASRSEASPGVTIAIGLAVFFIMGLLPIPISRLPNDRNPDSERWPCSGTQLIGAWAGIAIGPAIVLLGLARLLW